MINTQNYYNNFRLITISKENQQTICKANVIEMVRYDNCKIIFLLEIRCSNIIMTFSEDQFYKKNDL